MRLPIALNFPVRPANILLSDDDVPVLVDFGFAEKYELGTPKAFRSNLAYGTPEVNCAYSPMFTHISPRDFSTFRQNVLAAITTTRVNLTSGRLGLHSSKSSSVARRLST